MERESPIGELRRRIEELEKKVKKLEVEKANKKHSHSLLEADA